MSSKEFNSGSIIWFAKTLQGQICLCTTAILALLICIYGILAYTELRSDLLTNAGLGLEARVTPVIHHVAETNTGSFDQFATDLVSTLGWHGVNSTVVDANKKWVFGEKTAVPFVSGQSITYSDDNNNWILIYAFPLTWQGEDSGDLIARTSLRHVALTLQKERNLLLGGGLLALMAAFGLAYLLTRKILLPLQELSRTAGAVARNDMNVRAPVYGQSYEVDQLVTAFNSMLDRLQEAFNAQQKANLQVKQFMADASHELRSPLTAVTGYLEILQQGAVETPEEQERVFAAAKRELKRLSRLVDNLLTLARLESGLPLEKKPVNISRLLAEAGQRAADLDPDRIIQVDTAGECYFLGDEERIRQLINNLVDNALLHSGNAAKIDLGCCTEKGNVKFWIKDNGTGIAQEKLSFIFDRFWRGSDKFGVSRGTGLGLSIVQAIVDAHNGSIKATSNPGCDTSFVVTLPGEDIGVG